MPCFNCFKYSFFLRTQMLTLDLSFTILRQNDLKVAGKVNEVTKGTCTNMNGHQGGKNKKRKHSQSYAQPENSSFHFFFIRFIKCLLSTCYLDFTHCTIEKLNLTDSPTNFFSKYYFACIINTFNQSPFYILNHLFISHISYHKKPYNNYSK